MSKKPEPARLRRNTKGEESCFPMDSEDSQSMAMSFNSSEWCGTEQDVLPGIISSVTAAPPSTCLLSSTHTDLPALAKYAADTNPLCPT